MKSVYALNDLYPFSNATQTTTGETIPDKMEREHYNEQTVERADGKTEIVDFKNIFVAIAIFVGFGMLLNYLD